MDLLTRLFFAMLFGWASSLSLPSAIIAQSSDSAAARWQTTPSGRLQLSLSGTWSAEATQAVAQKSVRVPSILQNGKAHRLRRDFFLPDSLQNKAIILHILGINYQCRISLNGSPIASHAGGHTSFDFELKPEALRFGASNSLTIEIDGELTTHTTLPFKHRPFGWQHRIGILRDVFLEARPAISIDDVSVTQQLSNQYKDAVLNLSVDIQAFSDVADTSVHNGKLEVYCAVTQAEQPAPLAVSARKELVFSNTTGTTAQFALELLNVKKWSLQQPFLHQLEVFLVLDDRVFDRVTLPLGVRELRMQNRQILLNGEPFFVRGVTWFEDLSGLPVGEVRQSVDNIVNRLKMLGANVLRVVGHPPHPLLIERCSREGIGIFEEIPLYYANGVQMQSAQVQELALQQLDEMIARDAMQPSVLAWGLAVHIDEQHPAAAPLLNKLAMRARAADERLLYYVRRVSRSPAEIASVDFVLTDFFGKTAPAAHNAVSNGMANLPIFGFWAERGALGANGVADRKRSEQEEAQAEKLERAIEAFRSSWPDSAGFFVHALTDWRGAQPLVAAGSERDVFSHPAGLIDLDGKLRIGFRMVSAYHLQERKPQISPNESRPPQPIVFPLMGILAILLLLFNLNRDKKLRVQLRRAFVHPHGLYSDLFENRKTPAFLTILLGCFQGIILALLATSVFYHFRENLLFDEIVSLFVITPTIKQYVIWLIWHPGWMIVALTVSYFLLTIAFAVLLRMLGVFFRSTLNLFQYFTLVFWAAVNYLPLALIAPIFYRLLPDAQIALYSMIVIALFGLWHFMRVQRGLRVFYIISPTNAFLLCLILAGVFFGAIFMYYNQSQAILDYWDYYAGLIR